jgi:hypothetical protein
VLNPRARPSVTDSPKKKERKKTAAKTRREERLETSPAHAPASQSSTVPGRTRREFPEIYKCEAGGAACNTPAHTPGVAECERMRRERFWQMWVWARKATTGVQRRCAKMVVLGETTMRTERREPPEDAPCVAEHAGRCRRSMDAMSARALHDPNERQGRGHYVRSTLQAQRNGTQHLITRGHRFEKISTTYGYDVGVSTQRPRRTNSAARQKATREEQRSSPMHTPPAWHSTSI